MSGPGRVEAVIFDWGGTLTPWHTIDLVEQWHVYARGYARGLPEEFDGGPIALADRMVAAEQAAWARLRADGASARLTEVLQAAGIREDHPGYEGAQAAYEEFWEPHTVIDPQVPGLLATLRASGLLVGVLSNTIWTRAYHERVFARDGVLELLDGAVYTSEIPYVKPHPAAFEAAIAAVGCTDPARCVYVGDRPFEDVFGAQRAGMRAILVPHSDIPPSQQVPVDVYPDAVVGELREVADVVASWNA